jgi:hypothetical protein
VTDYDAPAQEPIDRLLVQELQGRMKESSAAASHHRSIAEMHQRVVDICQGALSRQEKSVPSVTRD